ncbi:tubulin binding cofactor C-domain-containing protein [Cryomyces antarcticus]|uniref:C-CAP/cofactor C-like domain-containing protein n=1 Tax=Cryomyces antarcticus TaxID=329879 RepID=A0ABR0LQK3_9PEZI|nr:hypothetical protein LTR39_000770 [Cryomyces antarcticus]KAK5020354.1 hypothetical protein LTR60_000590 [Cryomyces antarcticus]KAK5201860.1 hypothetical protein LTR16_001201 [Cryomyces antarcticus]
MPAAGAQQPGDLNARFFRHFQHEVTALQEQIDRLAATSVSGGERADATDHCLAGISRLSDEVKDASSYLPAYDQRTYSEVALPSLRSVRPAIDTSFHVQAIKALSEKLQDVRSAFAPRAKFSFTTNLTRKNASAISLNDAAELAAQQRQRVPGYRSDQSSAQSSFAPTPAYLQSPANEPMEEDSGGFDGNDPVNKHLAATQQAAIRKPSFSQSTSVKISNHADLHIILPSSAAHATSSGTLSNLRHCIVDMSVATATGRPFAGLTLKNIKDSLIVCGNVDGAAHITNVTNSVVVVASRQFRMHDCKSADVYLQTSSRPIIEACEGIRFAPLPETYVTDRGRQAENQWDQVDDFKWLKAEHSPNWSVIPQADRTEESVWKDLVPGGVDVGLEDVLKAVNVARS